MTALRALRRFFARHQLLYIATVTTLTLIVQVFGLPWEW